VKTATGYRWPIEADLKRQARVNTSIFRQTVWERGTSKHVNISLSIKIPSITLYSTCQEMHSPKPSPSEYVSKKCVIKSAAISALAKRITSHSGDFDWAAFYVTVLFILCDKYHSHTFRTSIESNLASIRWHGAMCVSIICSHSLFVSVNMRSLSRKMA